MRLCVKSTTVAKNKLWIKCDTNKVFNLPFVNKSNDY